MLFIQTKSNSSGPGELSKNLNSKLFSQSTILLLGSCSIFIKGVVGSSFSDEKSYSISDEESTVDVSSDDSASVASYMDL